MELKSRQLKTMQSNMSAEDAATSSEVKALMKNISVIQAA